MENQRVKYPLTDEAKEAAKYLVDCWKNNNWVWQLFRLHESTAGGENTIHTSIGVGELDPNFDPPSINILLELSKFGLVFIDYELLTTDRDTPQRQWHVLLMQELRNAVASDFEVSDYFLTVNAVGTVINGDNVTFNAPFQSAASPYGTISQKVSSSEIAEKLLATLGSDILRANNTLSVSVQDLKLSLESERQSKIGKVISELGHSIEHGANTFVVLQAIGFLAQFLR